MKSSVKLAYKKNDLLKSEIDLESKIARPQQRVILVQEYVIQIFNTVMSSIFYTPDFSIKSYSVKDNTKVERDYKDGLIAEVELQSQAFFMYKWK